MRVLYINIVFIIYVCVCICHLQLWLFLYNALLQIDTIYSTTGFRSRSFLHYCVNNQMFSCPQGQYIASVKGLHLVVYFFKKQKSYRWATVWDASVKECKLILKTTASNCQVKNHKLQLEIENATKTMYFSTWSHSGLEFSKFVIFSYFLLYFIYIFPIYLFIII